MVTLLNILYGMNATMAYYPDKQCSVDVTGDDWDSSYSSTSSGNLSRCRVESFTLEETPKPPYPESTLPGKYTNWCYARVGVSATGRSGKTTRNEYSTYIVIL